MSEAKLEVLMELVAAGKSVVDGFARIDPWRDRVFGVLSHAYDTHIARDFSERVIERDRDSVDDRVDRGIALLQQLRDQIRWDTEEIQKSPSANAKTSHLSDNERTSVFIVHGHDDGKKEAVARFVATLGLCPVILHEQADSGQTVIEKLEAHSERAGFAIVLLTPDDVGAVKSTAESLQARARQNVIFELGYFLAKLGRNRVCALHVDGVELPSDYHGVLYTRLDDSDTWRLKVAQEFVAVGMPIDHGGLSLGSTATRI